MPSFPSLPRAGTKEVVIDKIYIWRMKKGRVHIEAPDGNSFCMVENGGTRLNRKDSDVPRGRILCKVCNRLQHKKKLKKKKRLKRLRLLKKQKKPKKNFYKSAEWARLRYDALKKNDGKCELCGASKLDGVTLHVDHIKPYAKHPELRAEPSNFQVLCADCNWGKGNRDDTDWREPRLAVVMGESIE